MPQWAREGDLRPDFAREALRRSEEMLLAVFNNIAVGMAIMDFEGRFIDSNPALQGMLGYNGDEVRRMGYMGFVHPDDLPGTRAMLLDLRNGRKERIGLEMRYIRKGWEMRWGRMTASMVHDANGEPLFAIGVLEDTTEQKMAEEALVQVGVRYRELVDNAAAGVATADLEGNLTFVNRALCTMSGYAEEELVGRHFSEFLPPEDLQNMKGNFGAIFKGLRGGIALEFRLVRKDGRVVHCFTSPTVSWRNGEMVGFNAIIQDISERKRAEEELQKLASVVRHTSELISLSSPEGRMVFLNEAGGRMLGLSPENVGQIHIMDVIPEDLRKRVKDEVMPSLAAKGCWEGELQYRNRKDGQLTDVHAMMFTLKDPGTGAPLYIANVSRDITDKKRAESELVKLSTAIKLVNECILIMDPQENVLFANEAAHALIGRGPLASGWRFTDIVAPQDSGKWQLLLDMAIQKGNARNVECELRSVDGRPVIIEASATAMRDEDGRPTGIVAILRDIAERKLAQRQMRSRLMTYELEEGNLYLAKESVPTLAFEGFRDLLRTGYRGTIVSRTPPSKFGADAGQPFEFRWVSEKASEGSLPPAAAEIERWAEELPRNQAILLDRLDYLVSRNSFRRTLTLVHRLRELAYLMGHIIILSLDPTTLNAMEVRAFEKEADEVRPRRQQRVPPEHLDILKYVYQKSIVGERPSMTEVGSALRLCKPTVRKRVRGMARKGYIMLSPMGRTKVLELTEKGRTVFQK